MRPTSAPCLPIVEWAASLISQAVRPRLALNRFECRAKSASSCFAYCTPARFLLDKLKDFRVDTAHGRAFHRTPLGKPSILHRVFSIVTTIIACTACTDWLV